MPKDVAVHQTTMTYGGDVAATIASLIGNKKTFGEAFHLMGTEPKVYMPESSLELSKVMGNTMQVHYDSLYDRVFDNSKLMAVVGTLSFTPMKKGLESCLGRFLKYPKWKGRQHWRLEVYING